MQGVIRDGTPVKLEAALAAPAPQDPSQSREEVKRQAANRRQTVQDR
jgi:hypothetical protein